jgi:CBS domain-containing protein
MNVERVMSRQVKACGASDTLAAAASIMWESDHMSRQVFSVEPAASVEAAEQLMAEKQVRRLPVVGFEGELVGMITMGDLARAAVESHRREIDAREVAAIPSRIVKARRPELASA